MITAETLFDEFAAAYARGERPDVAAFLQRAGEQREELGSLIDRFLAAAPARATTEEEIALMEARLSGEPPLLLLRRRRKLARAAVVEAIVSAFDIPGQKRTKVADYYHQLETGLLDPRGVSRRVLDVIGNVLGADAGALARLWPAPPAPAYRREADVALSAEWVAAPAPERLAEDQSPDEVDRLFTSGN